ncbi:hypothetical protein IV203_027539 [Nitzschia inconspicua]|uniref:Uncharacterized protein n=1 Tax=Nitzschia inconspicua TaxID=303405 RepID=A0A9K3Q3L3_9STRA|nr:hypothetical protein IV203_027539 [Nitzschia inconspicua]
MFPGIFHTASPDADFDGEHMCVKIFSLPSAQQQQRSSSHDFYEQWNRVALEATRIAARSLDVNYTLLLENQRTHDVFYVDRGRNRIDTSNANNTLPGVGQKRRREKDFPFHLPGLSRFHVKVVRYRPNEVSKMGPDKYDMIVLVLEGQLNLLTQQRESGKNSTKTTAIPKHEWLVISAGTSHAFQTANSTENETALVLFIEVAPQ